MSKYIQGEVVLFTNTDGKKIKARVCGSHHTGLPIVGVGYIIEPLEQFADKEVYDFTHITTFEINLSKIEQ